MDLAWWGSYIGKGLPHSLLSPQVMASNRCYAAKNRVVLDFSTKSRFILTEGKEEEERISMQIKKSRGLGRKSKLFRSSLSSNHSSQIEVTSRRSRLPKNTPYRLDGPNSSTLMEGPHRCFVCWSLFIYRFWVLPYIDCFLTSLSIHVTV